MREMAKRACPNQCPRKGHAHSPRSYKAKLGRKTSPKGKQEAKRKLLSSPKVVVMAWMRKLSKLMAMLALESGYSLDYEDGDELLDCIGHESQ